MAKLELDPIGSLENQTSAVQLLNENFDRIENAFENTFSRDGTTPNQLNSPLDANSQRITNVGAPVTGTDAARWIDISESFILQGYAVPSLSGNTNKILTNDGTTLTWTAALSIPGLGDLKSTNNLSELTNLVTARTNLGLGTMAVEAVADFGKLGDNTTKTGNFTVTGQLTLGGTTDHRITSNPSALSVDSIGFRGVPPAQQDTDYTFVLNDAGKSKRHNSGTGHTFTVPPSVFPEGTVLVVDNIGAGVVTVARGAGVTIRLQGSGTSQDVAVAQYGTIILRQISTNTWIASGANIS